MLHKMLCGQRSFDPRILNVPRDPRRAYLRCGATDSDRRVVRHGGARRDANRRNEETHDRHGCDVDCVAPYLAVAHLDGIVGFLLLCAAGKKVLCSCAAAARRDLPDDV